MPDMPEQPKTKQLPAVDPIAEIKGLLVQGFKGVRADIDLLSGQIDSQGRRISELEAARQRASDRARALATTVSSADLSQESKLADAMIKVNETHTLATASAVELAAIKEAADARGRVLDDIALSLSTALKSKMAEKIAYALGGAILAAIAFLLKKYGIQ